MNEQQQFGTSQMLKTETVYVKPEKGGDNNTLCRVCLQEGNIPIYGNNDCFHDVSEDLNVCADINIRRDDPHPKHLCVNCNSLLQSAIQLRVIAQQSEQLLQQHKNYPGNEIFEKKNEKNTDVVIPGEKFNSDYMSISVEVCDNDQQSNNDADEDSKPLSSMQSSLKTVLHKKNTFDLKPSISKSNSNIKQNSNCSTSIQYSKDKAPLKYYCKRCHIYATKPEYRQHLLSDEHKNFKETCPFCNNQYDPAYFKRHLKHHKADICHICDVCGKNFSNKRQFVHHRRTHFLEFPAQCSLCPYRGRDNIHLKAHMRTHSDEKPHQCPHCPMRCNSKNNLGKHILTHKSERDFKCDTCQQGFHRQADLDRHIKVIHLGLKEHFCEICGKAFGYRKEMMKHSLKVHKREKFKSGRQPFYLLAEQQETSAQDDTVENS